MDSIQRVTPVALRTGSEAHQQDTAPLISNDLPYHSQFEWETKDLIQRLTQIKQADEHHMEIQRKIQMIYDQQILLSGMQASIALELQKELGGIRSMNQVTAQNRYKDAAIQEQLVKPIVIFVLQLELTTNQMGSIQHSASNRLEGTNYASAFQAYQTPRYN